MTAEKKDGHSGADSASADSPGISFPQRCSPDRWAPQDQLWELFRGQNPARLLHACSPERTSVFAIRPACCSSSPGRKPASRNRATPGVRGAAALRARLDGYRVAGPGKIEPDLRSPGEYCLT